MKQYVWGNPAILCQGNVIHDLDWCRNGVRQITDILSNTGEVRVNSLFSLVRRSADLYLKLNKIVNAIPKEWRTKIRSNHDLILDNEFHDVNSEVFGKLCTSNMYKRRYLYNSLMPVPAMSRTERYWGEKYEIEDCAVFYVSQGNQLIERKVREFKWRLLNRCLTTETKLKHIANSDGICKLCSIEIEDEEHILNCESQGEYWKYVNTCIARINNVKLNEQLLVIGYTVPGIEGNVINCVIEESSRA